MLEMDEIRKMASVQTITAIRPIPNADNIELASVLGWRVVVNKNDNFKVGDNVVYFEVGTVLPETDLRFAESQKWGQKVVEVDGKTVKGHILATRSFRGVDSQGMVMPIALFDEGIYYWEINEGEASSTDPCYAPRVGLDVTEAIGVFKYEEPIPPNTNIIGSFDTRYMPKSDCPRVQTLSEHWDEAKELKWSPTLKVDGTSTTILNDGKTVRIFSKNRELDTEDSNLLRVAEKFKILEFVEENPGTAVQFEYAGPGVHSNRAKLPAVRPFVFSVFFMGKKVARDDWDERLLAVASPMLGDEFNPANFDSLDELVEKVSTVRGNLTKDVADEGVVYHLAAGQVAPWWLSRTATFKVISMKYIKKHKLY